MTVNLSGRQHNNGNHRQRKGKKKSLDRNRKRDCAYSIPDGVKGRRFKPFRGSRNLLPEKFSGWKQWSGRERERFNSGLGSELSPASCLTPKLIQYDWAASFIRTHDRVELLYVIFVNRFVNTTIGQRKRLSMGLVRSSAHVLVGLQCQLNYDWAASFTGAC